MCTSPIFVKSLKMFVPCRHCLECRLQRAKEWAVRCWAESNSYVDNCAFVTLTYTDDSNPIVLRKSDFQAFMKRFRISLERKFGVKDVKYFACGEYGGLSLRPHFHAIIYGFNFPDRRFVKRTDKGYPLYTSELLTNVWGKGICLGASFKK